MPSSYRRLVVLAFFCLALLGIVAIHNIQNGLQFDGNLRTTVKDMNPPIIIDRISTNNETPPKPDQSFFQDSSKTSSSTDSSTELNITVDKIAVKAPVVPSDGISALAYIAANINTDKVYAERNVDQVLPVASMSKLVTAFAATDLLSATTSITITKEDADVPPDGSGIAAGETYTLSEILYPLLLDSSNVAAEALASTTDRVHFLELMSSYAWEIGMSTAYFADPSGVNPHNEASANDLFALAKYLYKYRPDILALTRVASTSVATTTEHGSHDFVSIHPFVNVPGFIGGKTGRTPEAGDTMLTIMNIGGQPVAIVVLGSKYDGRAEDTSKIIDMVKTKI